MSSIQAGFQLLAEQNGGGPFLPMQASSFASSVDYLMWFINFIAVFFTALIFVLTIWFCIKYHYKKHPHPERTGHNNALELTWTAIPTVIVFVMFFWGFFVFMELEVPAEDQSTTTLEINVEGYMWGWRYKYRHPDSGVEMTLSGDQGMYVPVNTPVRLILKSEDVLHSYFIPAFRTKKDVVPGRYNKMWFEATKEGTYDVYCAEYCGDLHSQMRSVVHVVQQPAYVAALRKYGDITKDPVSGRNLTPPEIGRALASQQGCFSCHADEGRKKGTGPAWTEVPPHHQAVGAGMSLEDYIRESILNPSAKIAPGYSNAMNPFRFNDQELGWLIAYIKQMNNLDNGPATTGPASGPAR